MKEARLIVPRGNPDVDRFVRNALAREFGGWTETQSNGGWYDMKNRRYHTEPINVYDIAMYDTDANRDKLNTLADSVQFMLDQEAMYLRYPDGEVALRSSIVHDAAA